MELVIQPCTRQVTMIKRAPAAYLLLRVPGGLAWHCHHHQGPTASLLMEADLANHWFSNVFKRIGNFINK